MQFLPYHIDQKKVLFYVKCITAIGTLGYCTYLFYADGNFYVQMYEVIVLHLQYKYNNPYFIASMMLMPINIFIEVAKWKFLASKHSHTSYIDAAKGVVAGLTLGFITPHALGDYLARVYFMKSDHKIQSIGLVLISRISQFYITLFFGLLGFYVMYRFSIIAEDYINFPVLVLFAVCCVLSVYLMTHYDMVEYFLLSFKPLAQINYYFLILKQYSLNDFSTVLLLSLGRYVVFCMQFLFLLKFFEIDYYNILIIAGVWLIFFVKSLLPTFNFLTGLGVREVATLFFLGNLGLQKISVVSASFMLWLINILLPVMVGLIVIITARFRKITT
ncbi:MAG: lysylphosphatidylglycerol synthase domain-containing protein [Cytophagales bacterium]|nr:lysylphosphatidylglycerol synthase domain-containing protein [Cytophagales bacterium]